MEWTHSPPGLKKKLGRHSTFNRKKSHKTVQLLGGAHEPKHTDLCLIADKQLVLHGVGDVSDEELQGAALRYPGKSTARPRSGATRLVLPGLGCTALRIYKTYSNIVVDIFPY